MASLTHKTDAVDTRICLALELINTSSKVVPGNPRVLSLLSLSLERIIKQNEKRMETTKGKQNVTIFHGIRTPTLSIQQYIDRLFKYSKCSPSCFVVAQIYIDRFLQRVNVHLTSLNIHRLLITSLMVAAKFIDDSFLNNAYYAKVGGVSTAELNRMEINFLFSLDFRLQVTVETFERYCLQLEREGNGGYQIEQKIQIFG